MPRILPSSGWRRHLAMLGLLASGMGLFRNAGQEYNRPGIPEPARGGRDVAGWGASVRWNVVRSTAVSRSAPWPKRLFSAAFPYVLMVLTPLFLVEVSLRVAEPLVPELKLLLYHSGVPVRFDEVQTLEELMGLSVTSPGRRIGDFITNSKGFRAPEYSESKAEGSYRILAIGDSFTYSSGGVPFREHWTHLLRQGLQGRTEAEVEVLNLGVPAVGTEFEKRLWELEGSKLEADLVVLAFAIGTDFANSVLVRGRELSVIDRAALHSYAFRVVRNLFIVGRMRAGRPAVRSEGDPVGAPRRAMGVPVAEVAPGARLTYDPSIPKQPEEDFLRGQVSHCKTLCLTRGRTNEVFETAFSFNSGALLGLRDRIEETATPWLVMLIPDVFQVYDEVRESVVELSGRARSEFDFERPQRRLRSLLEREHIPYLDLLEPFRAAGEDGLYRFLGTHWSPKGNALAARLLTEFIAERFLPDGDVAASIR